METQSLSSLERYALLKTHPRKIILDLIAWSWLIYFLAYNDWLAAILSFLLSSLLGWFAVRNVNAAALAETFFGKIALLHLHPFNLTTQFVGVVPLLYGVWTHSGMTMMVGISVILIGHLFGWGKVSSYYS